MLIGCVTDWAALGEAQQQPVPAYELGKERGIETRRRCSCAGSSTRCSATRARRSRCGRASARRRRAALPRSPPRRCYIDGTDAAARRAVPGGDRRRARRPGRVRRRLQRHAVGLADRRHRGRGGGSHGRAPERTGDPRRRAPGRHNRQRCLRDRQLGRGRQGLDRSRDRRPRPATAAAASGTDLLADQGLVGALTDPVSAALDRFRRGAPLYGWDTQLEPGTTAPPWLLADPTAIVKLFQAEMLSDFVDMVDNSVRRRPADARRTSARS